MKTKMIRAVLLSVIGCMTFTTVVCAKPITETDTKIYKEQDKKEIVGEITEEIEIDVKYENEDFVLTDEGYIEKEDLYEKMYVTAEIGLNLRPEPTTECERYTAVPYNTELKIKKESIKEDTEWYIGYNDEYEFYVHKDYLSYEKQPELEEEYSLSYLGEYRITHYCPNGCCGSAGGRTASGITATPYRTVAMKDIPFGTKISINGNEYVVEDRGVGYGKVDICVTSHEEALDLGVYYADVYVID